MVAMPLTEFKQEGALKVHTSVDSTHGQLVLEPDTFFDGEVFDLELLK